MGPSLFLADIPMFHHVSHPGGTTSLINKQFASIDSCPREHYH